MAKQITSTKHDKNIVNELKKINSPVFDKKHNLYIYFNDVKSRSNETRFEHIAKVYHQLKVRDIKLLEKGINDYLLYKKDQDVKDTFYYIIKRKGEDKGFIKMTILVDLKNKTIAYVKSIYVVYRFK